MISSSKCFVLKMLSIFRTDKTKKYHGKTLRKKWASSSCWLEQRTHNPLVPCSTHGRPTRILVIESSPYEKSSGLFSFLCPLKSFKNWPLPEFCRNEKIQTKQFFNFWRT